MNHVGFALLGAVQIAICWALLTQPSLMVLIVLMATVALTVMTLKCQYAVFVLAFLVPIAADHVGFSIISNWHVEMADFVPLFSVFVMCAFSGLLLKKACGLHSPQSKHPATMVLVLLTCWSAATLLWPYDIHHNAFQFVILGLNCILYYVVIQSVDNETALKRLVWCWIASGIIVSSLTLLSSLLDAKHVFGYEIGERLKFHLEWYALPVRAEGLANVNETAMILNLTTCVTIGMFLIAKDRRQSLFLFGAALFMVLANFLTMSRGGLLSLLAMMYFLIASLKKLNAKPIFHMVVLHFLVAALFVAHIAVTIIASPDTGGSNKPVRVTTAGQTSFLTGRLNLLWKPACEQLFEEGPAKGLSIGSFKSYRDVPHGHSIYISTLVDLGVIGFSLVAILAFILLTNFNRVRRFQNTDIQILYVSMYGGLVAIAVHGLVDFEYNTPEIWFFLGLVVSAYNLVKKQISDATEKR